jgi:cysteine synthase A
MPDQFRNPANPAVHERTTGPEIVEQLGGAPHALVSAIGTGGTITGVGRVFRRARPDCRIVGVEPARSAVLSGDPPGPHKIQGIGAGFVPDILDRDLVTEIRTVLDIDAYRMKGRLAREEGLLVGISSGANVEVAARLAAELGPGHRVVTILCDTGERYFSLDEYFEQREAKP